MNYAYGRVSSQQQNLDRQVDLFKKLEIPDRYIFIEKMTGTKKNRPQLERLLDEIRDGDTIYIESLSRLGRSTKDLLELIEYFDNNGIQLISHSENIDTTSPTGKLLTQLMCILAEFERNIIVERTKQGLESARVRGRKGGRKSKSKKDIQTALTLYDSKDYSIREICEQCNMTHGTLYKYINQRKEKV